MKLAIEDIIREAIIEANSPKELDNQETHEMSAMPTPILVADSLSGEIHPLDTPQNETIHNFLQRARAINTRGPRKSQLLQDDNLSWIDVLCVQEHKIRA